ncbi:hypothetical protein EDC01DRAFT_779267 [Geopyxis carbonaria]|nr:hypothetical protein EDC01DRAFT_779267 [Geopyxis carbonaria]
MRFSLQLLSVLAISALALVSAAPSNAKFALSQSDPDNSTTISEVADDGELGDLPDLSDPYIAIDPGSTDNSTTISDPPINDGDLPDITDDLPVLNTTSLSPSSAADSRIRFSGYVVCETSASSPRLHDIDYVIRAIRGRNRCAKLGSNLCETIARQGWYAGVSLCGKPWFPFRGDCEAVANHVQQIKDTCTRGMYAGGRFVRADNWWIALHK